MMLERLNACNEIKILSCFDKAFSSFGRIITDYDFSAMREVLCKSTPMPASENIYVASDAGLEACAIRETVQNELFGGMPIQIGFCNGFNSRFNAMEYHKCSEINVAGTDLCVALGHVWDIQENHFQADDITVFYVPKGTVFEMYATTLHFSPIKVSDEGFKNVVILPLGTNTPLENKPQNPQGEAVLLLQKNKWLLAHPEREPLMKQGAYPGFIGENKEIKY